MYNPKIVIVVLNMNGKEVLDECLNSIQRLDYPNYIVSVSGVTTTQCLLSIQHRAGTIATRDVNINWLAIGEA